MGRQKLIGFGISDKHISTALHIHNIFSRRRFFISMGYAFDMYWDEPFPHVRFRLKLRNINMQTFLSYLLKNMLQVCFVEILI